MKPHSFKNVFCAFGFTLFFVTQAAHAVVVAQYNFTGGSGASSDSDSSVAGTFAGAGGGTISSGTGTAYFLGDTTSSGEATAVSGNDYFSFTITPAAGTTLDLTTLTFDLGGNTAGTGAFVVSAFVRTGLDTFATTVGSPSVSATSVPDSSGSTPMFENRSVDLSSLTSISATTVIRIYIYDTTTQGGAVARIDNVVLSADVIAVPEPSAYALVFAAFAGLAALRRRRAA